MKAFIAPSLTSNGTLLHPWDDKIFSWDAPKNRGSWADHGIEGVFIGPALKHFRSFNIWVPSTSALRIANTVWWFMVPIKPSQEFLQLDLEVACPPTRNRPNPPKDGSDLLGRHFVEPELGVCCTTALGPIARKHAEHNQLRTPGDEPQIPTGLRYTFYYNQLLMQTEYLSSVTEILNWIQIGPILPPNVEDTNEIGTLPITTPPATALLNVPMTQPTALSEAEILPLAVTNSGPLVNVSEQTCDLNSIPVTIATITSPITSQSSGSGLTRKSTRTKTTRDFLKPKFQGKAYNIGKQRVYNFKEQRVSACDSEMDENWYLRPMPKSTLPPVFRKGSLNLNADGTKTNYKNRMPDNTKYIGNKLTLKK
jgi:hypothetical protein